MIDPGTDPDGEDFEAYNRRRWGSSGWTHHLKHEGRKDGAQVNHWVYWPNTKKAHQFIQYFAMRGIDTDRLNHILFQKLYEQGINISVVDELVQIAEQELNEIIQTSAQSQELRDYLQQDHGWNTVQYEIRNGRAQYNIRGVPYFIIETNNHDGNEENNDNHRYGFSGAQSVRTFLEIFRELSESF